MKGFDNNMSTVAFKYFSKYQETVKHYCLENGLDYYKLLDCSFGKGKNSFSFAHSDGHTDGSLGLLDDTPMPCVLWVNINPDGSLTFTQTEYTKQFVSSN
ncbi:MAG: hypothetical protein LBM87_02175 [Ruminococcus sp.]|jgi:hypothetical protein|nr:hypothetical protein [Ruminococcus sp.]